MTPLLPNRDERNALWSEVVRQAEAYFENVESLPVAPALEQSAIRRILDAFSFDEPGRPLEVLNRFTEELKRFQVHTPHPRYFGFFQSSPSVHGHPWRFDSGDSESAARRVES